MSLRIVPKLPFCVYVPAQLFMGQGTRDDLNVGLEIRNPQEPLCWIPSDLFTLSL